MPLSPPPFFWVVLTYPSLLWVGMLSRRRENFIGFLKQHEFNSLILSKNKRYCSAQERRKENSNTRKILCSTANKGSCVLSLRQCCRSRRPRVWRCCSPCSVFCWGRAEGTTAPRNKRRERQQHQQGREKRHQPKGGVGSPSFLSPRSQKRMKIRIKRRTKNQITCKRRKLGSF